MLGNVGEREDCRWKNVLITIFAGYLVEENLCIRAVGLGNGYRLVRPDKAVILQRKRGDTILGTSDTVVNKTGMGEG